MAGVFSTHKALQPIVRDPEDYPLTSRGIEDLKLFVLRSGGQFRDIGPAGYRRTGLTSATAGTKTGGGMQIRGGSV